MAPKGIFCIEGLWNDNLRAKASVAPILSMLEMNGGIPFIHQTAATKEELEFYISKWKHPTLKNYPILYLAFHGARSAILIGGKKYSLNNLAMQLEESCSESILIFASCKTLCDDGCGSLSRFFEITNALALFGYMNKVNWMHSAALELLILTELQDVTFSCRGMSALQKKIKLLASAFPHIDCSLVTRQNLKMILS